MKRKTFIKAMEALEAQMDYDNKMSDKSGEAFPNAFTPNLLYNNTIIIDGLINVLKKEMKDNFNWIEWFIYDTDFGKDRGMSNIFELHNKKRLVSNAGELYDFLRKIK